MPDEFELPETPESPEKSDRKHERAVGLTISAIAVVLAVVTHLGNETNNERIVAHVDATDKFNFYQAKKERRYQLEIQSDNVHLQFDRLSPAAQTDATKLLGQYAAQIKKLEDDGTKIQAEGDELLEESKRLQGKASFIEIGEIALQISVVLSSVTVLTEQNLFVRLGVAIALGGVLSALWGLFFAY